ncbi:MAG: Cro/Cl family transcriptional regulator [Treponema sp.]|uniref:Cro/Cl family transcriptional regulator n=1 Tax=Treponema sp. TaxID=166 RepID=UPI002579BA6F|nr:Cro/Cl family transcriptional regulator [Treponema sp.]MBQ5536999.1 Cro/Cl family transcriptional regulator [Treponema sp.]
MQVDYSNLWIRYKATGHKNETGLIPLAGISTNILAKLNKGGFVSMESLKKYAEQAMKYVQGGEKMIFF